jgi:hypothetical protein
MDLYLILLILFTIGATCYYTAKKKERNPFIWFFIGFFFGLMGLLLLVLLPKARKAQVTKQNQFSQQEQNIANTADVAILSPYKEMQWYYLNDNHEPKGPLYFSEMLDAWIKGVISVKSYVWQDQMNVWQQIHEISDFMHLLETEETYYRNT